MRSRNWFRQLADFSCIKSQLMTILDGILSSLKYHDKAGSVKMNESFALSSEKCRANIL